MAQSRARLPLLDVIAYGLPAASVGYLSLLQTLYFFKYATDELLIAPAVMGTLFLTARVWDAISDPLAGYLSDRTRSRLGRRRPWMLAAAVPLAAVALLPWTPPRGLEGTLLVLWVGVGLLAWETAATAFAVPHTALGAELTVEHHERTRVFAFRHVAAGLGFVLVAGALQAMTVSEDKRATAFWLAGGGGVASLALITFSAARLREPPEHQGRPAPRPVRALGDVWRNPHARLLLIVFLIESLGAATLGVLGPYLTQYVLGDESLFAPLLVSYFVPTLLFVPVGLPLARRYGKKATWAGSMILSGLSFGLLFLASPARRWLIFASGIGAGIGGAVGAMVGPSVQADVVDYDEYITGERKEGTYFATWNFVRKCATGVTGWLTGIALQLVGFRPNVAQGPTTLLAMRALIGLFPLLAFAFGVALFLRFRLTEDEHRRIRLALDAHRASEARPAAAVAEASAR
jgi:GPH family glycoside/pentoside/hexuronide:cation symporter